MGRGIHTIQFPPSATVSTPPVGSSASSVAHAVVSLTPGASSLSSVASVSSSGTPESCVIQEAESPSSAEVIARSVPDPEDSSSAGNLSQSTTSLIRRPKTNKVCPLGCPGTNTQVKRHLGHNHFPWFFFPQDACFKCRAYAGSPCFLQHKHVDIHEEPCTFSDEHVTAWVDAMANLLEVTSKYLGSMSIFGLVAHTYSEEFRPSAQHQHSSLRAHLLILIEAQARRTLPGGIDLSNPNCPAATLNWVVFAKFLDCMSMEQQLHIKCMDLPVNLTVARPFYLKCKFADAH